MEITLRRFQLSDLDDFWIWASDEHVAATCSWEAYTCKHDLQHFMEETAIPNPWFRAIIAGGRAVGAVSVKLPEAAAERCRGELGYVVARVWWGKGVATAAVRLATEKALEEIDGLVRVEALVENGNEGSKRVLEKVGFRREGLLRRYWWNKGLLRDMVMFSFTTDDFFLV